MNCLKIQMNFKANINNNSMKLTEILIFTFHFCSSGWHGKENKENKTHK